jgi:lysozyme family protein
MANWKLLENHIATWEGKTSADPVDTCAKRPSAAIDNNPRSKYRGLPIHTNKGVCFSTWQSMAPKLGYDPSTAGFMAMTTDQWRGIIKRGFWDPLFLDNMRSQKIAELLLEVHWGSGMGGVRSVYRILEKAVGVPVTGKPSAATTEAFNKAINTQAKENRLYDQLWQFRMEWLRKLPETKWNKYGRGWTNRMNALATRAKNLVLENPKTSILGALIVGIGIFFFVRRLQKK